MRQMKATFSDFTGITWIEKINYLYNNEPCGTPRFYLRKSTSEHTWRIPRPWLLAHIRRRPSDWWCTSTCSCCSSRSAGRWPCSARHTRISHPWPPLSCWWSREGSRPARRRCLDRGCDVTRLLGDDRGRCLDFHKRFRHSNKRDRCPHWRVLPAVRGRGNLGALCVPVRWGCLEATEEVFEQRNESSFLCFRLKNPGFCVGLLDVLIGDKWVRQ